MLWVGLAVVVVVAFAWGLWGVLRDTAVEDPVATARPTGSVWNESPPPKPTPTPTPMPSNPIPSPSAAVDCPVVDNILADHPRDGRVHGGGLSFSLPDGWNNDGGWSRLLTDQSGASRIFEGGWGSFLSVGAAPSAAGFLDPALTATQVVECHVTSSRFSGYTGYTIESSEETTVDGSPGWWIRARATSMVIPGGSATFDVVVVDTGSPETDAVYWAGVVDADAKALADLDVVRADLQISD